MKLKDHIIALGERRFFLVNLLTKSSGGRKNGHLSMVISNLKVRSGKRNIHKHLLRVIRRYTIISLGLNRQIYTADRGYRR